jgi:DNA (cytosine-5)-methyltransferase 1
MSNCPPQIPGWIGSPSSPIPVIDLFAGAGGLSEGFTLPVNKSDRRRFDVRVSVEKDRSAHQTLRLRSIFHAFPAGRVPDCYYEFIRGDITESELERHPLTCDAFALSKHRAMHAELGSDDSPDIEARIGSALSDASGWVLLGGPPCQAYSLAGRGRSRARDPIGFEKDPRHVLYREYLHIIRKFSPDVFVMENVTGILTSQLEGTRIFERIIEDLKEPGGGAGYDIRSLVVPNSDPDPRDFVIRCEEFGIPQRRHRVVLLGIRRDVARRLSLAGADPEDFLLRPEVTERRFRDALRDLPGIRSSLNDREDDHQAWLEVLSKATRHIRQWRHPGRDHVREAMDRALRMAELWRSPGDEFLPTTAAMRCELDPELGKWFHDPRLEGVVSHRSRSHMPGDLHRYLFAASYAHHYSRSPLLHDFPESLLPNHASARSTHKPFADRFRVQVMFEPSTTVVSHIAQDGHYYIHPDPSQCRSLTVREAARLQTFQDNYYFAGSRSAQFRQIGNAVPPMLSAAIAEVVAKIFDAAAGRNNDLATRDVNRIRKFGCQL